MRTVTTSAKSIVRIRFSSFVSSRGATPVPSGRSPLPVSPLAMSSLPLSISVKWRRRRRRLLLGIEAVAGDRTLKSPSTHAIESATPLCASLGGTPNPDELAKRCAARMRGSMPPPLPLPLVAK